MHIVKAPAPVPHPGSARKRLALDGSQPNVGKKVARLSDEAWQRSLSKRSSDGGQHQGKARRQIQWPDLRAVSRLQAPDNWSWSSSDRSPATSLSFVGQEFHSVKFHPYWSNFSTAGVRGTKRLRPNGVHYWQILIPGRVFGTSMMIGVGTERAKTHTDGFVHLLGGLDDQSWGLCHNGNLYHNGRSIKYTSPFPMDKPILIGVLYDGQNDSLTFYRNGRCLGVAFTGLPKGIMPMLSSTSAQTEMLLCCQLRNYDSLQDRCAQVLASSVDYSERRISSLPLPPMIIDYVSQATLL